MQCLYEEQDILTTRFKIHQKDTRPPWDSNPESLPPESSALPLGQGAKFIEKIAVFRDIVAKSRTALKLEPLKRHLVYRPVLQSRSTHRVNHSTPHSSRKSIIAQPQQVILIRITCKYVDQISGIFLAIERIVCCLTAFATALLIRLGPLLMTSHLRFQLYLTNIGFFIQKTPFFPSGRNAPSSRRAIWPPGGCKILQFPVEVRSCCTLTVVYVWIFAQQH